MSTTKNNSLSAGLKSSLGGFIPFCCDSVTKTYLPKQIYYLAFRQFTSNLADWLNPPKFLAVFPLISAQM